MKDQIAIRKALVSKGLRTFAFSFDGSGDSGSLNDLLFAPEFGTPLEEFELGCDLEQTFLPSKTYQFVDGIWQYLPVTTSVEAQAIVESVGMAHSVLEDMAYAALENFDGDWVNNDGGYGVVAIDLVTGEYRIDGWQRYSDTNKADSDGTCFDPIDTNQSFDLTKHLKSTLNVG